MSLLGLVPDYGSDSSSSSESDEGERNSDGFKKDLGGKDEQKDSQNAQIPLPLPTLDFGKNSETTTKELNQRAYKASSVFFNPFLAEEKKKLSVLEKHVQLSESKPAEENNRKKQICFKFQKGRCRLGDKCRFSHGIATGSSNIKPDHEKPKEPSLAPSFSNAASSYEPDEGEESWEQKKKKKRKSGVTDSLVPPKRAMEAYDKQRLNDKPWTQ